MAQWRDFDASNDPDTCLWCGRRLRLRAVKSHTVKLSSAYEKPDGTWVEAKFKTIVDKRADKPGDYGDGFFCGLRCAYSFGEAMARNGRRLAPR